MQLISLCLIQQDVIVASVTVVHANPAQMPGQTTWLIASIGGLVGWDLIGLADHCFVNGTVLDH